MIVSTADVPVTVGPEFFLAVFVNSEKSLFSFVILTVGGNDNENSKFTNGNENGNQNNDIK